MLIRLHSAHPINGTIAVKIAEVQQWQRPHNLTLIHLAKNLFDIFSSLSFAFLSLRQPRVFLRLFQFKKSCIAPHLHRTISIMRKIGTYTRSMAPPPRKKFLILITGGKFAVRPVQYFDSIESMCGFLQQHLRS